MTENSLIKHFATAVSVLLHPLFIFFYLVLYLVYFTDVFFLIRYTSYLWIFLVYVLLNTVAIPIIIIYLYSRDLLMTNKNNRLIPYLVMIVVYCFMLFIFWKFYISALFFKIILSIIIGLIVLLISNFFIKSSLHTFSMGCMLAFFFRLYLIQPNHFFYPLMIIICIAGITGSARLFLEAHTKTELSLGYGIGLLTASVILNF